VKKKTLANLSHLPDNVIELIRKALKGEDVQSPTLEASQRQSADGAAAPPQALLPGFPPTINDNLIHGQVMVALKVIRELGLEEIISSNECQERNLVLAMIVNRIIRPKSKLSTVSWWKTTTLVDELGLEDADEDDLYAAMDWLYQKQGSIETKLAQRHLEEGGSAIYDLSSSYLEGGGCELAMYGYSRDKKRGKVQINFGLLTDRQGRPVSIEVYPGNITDSISFCPVVEKIRNEFNLNKLIIVGDSGMMVSKNIEILKGMKGIDWISALKTISIKSLVKDNIVQPSLFDERNILEIHAPDDYPGERLIFCRNPALAKKRTEVRLKLLEKTDEVLEKIKKRVDTGRLKGQDKISLAIDRVIDNFKMKKHFILEITNTSFIYTHNLQSINSENILDGIYLIITSLNNDTIRSDDVVREYKNLKNVERSFRSIKMKDLHIRPIYHYEFKRVKTHFFICMLAYYVLWHLKEAWRPLIFTDEESNLKDKNNPVTTAKQSDSAIKKLNIKKSIHGFDLSNFKCLFARFGTITKSIVELKLVNIPPITYKVQSEMDAHQAKAFELLDTIKTL
jgi:transposase